MDDLGLPCPKAAAFLYKDAPTRTRSLTISRSPVLAMLTACQLYRFGGRLSFDSFEPESPKISTVLFR